MPKSISIGSEVELELADQRRRFVITERGSDPDDGIISWLSPVGTALLGHEEGDVVEIVAPGNRKMETRVLKVY